MKIKALMLSLLCAGVAQYVNADAQVGVQNSSSYEVVTTYSGGTKTLGVTGGSNDQPNTALNYDPLDRRSCSYLNFEVTTSADAPTSVDQYISIKINPATKNVYGEFFYSNENGLTVTNPYIRPGQTSYVKLPALDKKYQFVYKFTSTTGPNRDNC